jgi:hypothetical protein
MLVSAHGGAKQVSLVSPTSVPGGVAPTGAWGLTDEVAPSKKSPLFPESQKAGEGSHI